MRTFAMNLSLAVFCTILMCLSTTPTTTAFTTLVGQGRPYDSVSRSLYKTSSSAPAAANGLSRTRLQMIFGPPKDDGSPGDYVCKDCGYVFTKGPKAWAALPDNYRCPPCGAPKFRFSKVKKGSASGKVDVKKSWFEK